MVTVDAASSTPPFEQIRAQFAARIAAGELVAGTRLPTVRGLAGELGVAVNTVARSYRDLEAAGLIETRGRAGSVVTAGGDTRREQLREQAQRYAELAREIGATPAEALRYVTAALGRAD